MNENDIVSSQDKAAKFPVFRIVFSSILGAIIGSAPGILMSLLSSKGGRADKLSGHVTMVGGMIGAMLGHDLVHWQDKVQQEKDTATKKR